MVDESMKKKELNEIRLLMNWWIDDREGNFLFSIDQNREMIEWYKSNGAMIKWK